MFKLYKKYGFWKWDMKAFFIMIPSTVWIPVVLYFSHKDLGKRLTKFTKEYMSIDILSSGRLYSIMKATELNYLSKNVIIFRS